MFTQRACSSFACTPVIAEWGRLTRRRKVQVRPHHRHHASQPPLAACVTTYPVQAVYASEQVPSLYGTIIPGRHVQSRVVYSQSSTSPPNCSSLSDDSVQSSGAMWITQLRHFRPLLSVLFSYLSVALSFVHFTINQIKSNEGFVVRSIQRNSAHYNNKI